MRQKAYRRFGVAPYLFAAAIVVLGVSPATAQTVVSYTMQGADGAYGLAAGPDGNEWFTDYSADKIGRIDIATGVVTEFPIPIAGAEPFGITVGPDGNLWFTGFGVGIVGKITTSGTVTTYPTSSFNTEPTGITTGPDGNLWFTEQGCSGCNPKVASKVAKITPSGTLTEYATPTGFSGPFGIVVGPDGNLWFAEFDAYKIGKVTPSGSFTEYAIPSPVGPPNGIIVGSDGALWFNEDSGPAVTGAEIGRITTAGAISQHEIPEGGTGGDNLSYWLTAGPDGQIWVTAGYGGFSAIARATTSGTVTLFTNEAQGGSYIGFGPNNAAWVATNGTTIYSFATAVLTAGLSGNGAGTVTSNAPVYGGQIDCTGGASGCSLTYMIGLPVTLTATAASGSTFAGWSGGGCSGTSTCTVTMSANTGVTATFTAVAETLTVAEAGTGNGQITSSPAGINCSASSNQCAAPFALGTQVTLTASASAGSSFAGWSGGGCSGTSPCVVTMNAAQSVTATFTVIPSFMLSVVPSGNGSGTVTSSPSGINCGGTCAASFQSGTQVVLSAVSASGSTFAGWSGGGCGGDQTCTVTLGAATTVNASFVAVSAGNLTLVAAVLPLSRSVEIGNTATAFATMIDAGPDNAATCTIAPATGIPASFVFQTTDPTTNALTGTANTPANIAAGQAQSFVIALTPTAAFAPTDVAFTFTCANAPSPAASITGVDTLNLSGSTTPVPDVVALATSGDPGFVDIPGANGTGVFAVATVNLGIDATITAAANTGTANLPVTLTICQTNPTSGACLATPAPSATTDIQPNATPTFGIFVAGNAPVANLPGVNRVFVTLTDSAGTLRGETSVAVRTQ
jgi:streptogramin lyase